MLVIRQEQTQALRMAQRARFIERLMSLFAGLWPQQTSKLGNDYRHFIESSVERAIFFGIETESAVARFVNLSFVWGPEFELRAEHAWALDILEDSNLREQIKIHEL